MNLSIPMQIKTLRITLFILSLLVTIPVFSQTMGNSISGVVIDRSSKKKLPGVTITVPNSNIAVVTNDDGTFQLKLPTDLEFSGIIAQQIGYHQTRLSPDYLESHNPVTILMARATHLLPEVTVKSGDPRKIIEEALRKIPSNYSSDKTMSSAFYRETVRKGNRYVAVSEAMVDVFKNSYRNRNTAGDKVQLRKGRRLISQKAADTLAVKIVGGPYMPVVLDVVKNEDVLLSINELDDYLFVMEEPEMLDDRFQYVIRFTPTVIRDYAMTSGKLFIDRETLSITRAEFSLDMKDKDKATAMMLYRKPRTLRFTPQEMSFVVNYKFSEGKSYLNYISTLTRFKCDWKRKLFSSPYVAFSELVIVDREDNPEEGIARKNAFGQRDVFYDMVENYWDPDFWNDYNIIEPTENLEKAVTKLKKTIKQN